MNCKPVLAHKFIRKLQDNKQLFINYTQNIDGLELDAGVKLEYLIQAHGHMRTAHCIECKEEGSMEKFKEALKKQEVLYCEKCHGLVKPDIIFFGEALPAEFFASWKKVHEADLILVMGTSLKVMPFAMLPKIVSEDVPN
jgi:NAD-dependent SIR2 family protein deacetylase